MLLVGCKAASINKALKILQHDGYVEEGRESGSIRVHGEHIQQNRIKEYGDPLKYISQYVSLQDIPRLRCGD